jgi:hypothetical protein
MDLMTHGDSHDTCPGHADEYGFGTRSLFCHQCLVEEIRRLRDENEKLINAFSHQHHQKPDSNDSSCMKCGLDLKNKIHVQPFGAGE